MTARRAVASFLGAAVVVLVPACGQRSAVWNTALADTDCHASDTVVRKLKGDPGKYVVYACGEELVYRCDANACARVADPAAAPVTTGESPEATPLVPSLEGPAPRDEPDSAEPTPDAPSPAEPADAPPSEDPAPSEAAPDETDAAGEVPEPP